MSTCHNLKSPEKTTSTEERLFSVWAVCKSVEIVLIVDAGNHDLLLWMVLFLSPMLVWAVGDSAVFGSFCSSK